MLLIRIQASHALRNGDCAAINRRSTQRLGIVYR